MTCPCPSGKHSEICLATPIYAELALTTNCPQEVINTMYMEIFEFPCAAMIQPSHV